MATPNINTPNYNQILIDMINQNKIDKRMDIHSSKSWLEKNQIGSSFDLIKIEEKLFSNYDNKENGRLRAYTLEDVLEIVSLNLEHGLSIRSLSKKFKISNSTILKWVRKYKKEQQI